MKRLDLALVVLLASSGCGENSDPPEGSDASTADGGCAPRLTAQFEPTWRAPRSVPRACTDAQIETSLMLCNGVSANAGPCNAWNRDPSNAACRTCLLTTEDEPSYGAIVVLKNRFRQCCGVSGARRRQSEFHGVRRALAGFRRLPRYGVHGALRGSRGVSGVRSANSGRYLQLVQ